MRKFTRQTVTAIIVTLLFTLPAFSVKAQKIPKADNSIHDRMYNLVKKSKDVVLPTAVAEKLEAINSSNPNKNKAIHTQASVLKVLYNKTLSKDDIQFFGNQVLKSSSASITAISADIKKLLTP